MEFEWSHRQSPREAGRKGGSDPDPLRPRRALQVRHGGGPQAITVALFAILPRPRHHHPWQTGRGRNGPKTPALGPRSGHGWRRLRRAGFAGAAGQSPPASGLESPEWRFLEYPTAAGVGYTGAGVGYTPLQQVHPLAPDSETEAENHFGQEYADRIKK